MPLLETPEPAIPGDDEDENAAAAMRADERENKKNLSDQDLVAKIYGYNPDENQEELPWPKQIDPDDAFDNDLGDGPDTDESDKMKSMKKMNLMTMVIRMLGNIKMYLKTNFVDHLVDLNKEHTPLIQEKEQ